MALNIKDPEVELLAAEAAGHSCEELVNCILARVRTGCPDGDFGRTMSKMEKEEILGYGPAGV